MNLDPNQIEMWKKFLPQSTIEYLLNPTSETLGQSLDGIATAICWPLLKLRVIEKAKLEQFAKEIQKKNQQIPLENRDSSKIGLAIKAIEEARYQLNEDDIRKLYVNLISSTVDNRKNNMVSPRLASVVSQFSPNEAELLKIIYEQRGNQLPLGYLTVRSTKSSDIRIVSGYLCSSDNGNFFSNKDTSIDILNSLGIIELYTDQWLAFDTYMKQYKIMENILKQAVSMTVKDDEKFELNKCYLKLNSFGKSLCHCIFQ